MNENVYIVFTSASATIFNDRGPAVNHSHKFERAWLRKLKSGDVAKQVVQSYASLTEDKVGSLDNLIKRLSDPPKTVTKSKRKRTFYCVFRGNRTGVTRHWTKAKRWIGNHRAPYYRKYPSKGQAMNAFSKYKLWERYIKSK